MFEEQEKTDVLRDLYEGKINFAGKFLSTDMLKNKHSKKQVETADRIVEILKSEEKLSLEEAMELVDDLAMTYADEKSVERYESFKNGFILGGKIAIEMMSK